MGMEHIHTGEFVSEFKNAALGLPLNDRIRKFTGHQAGAGRVVLEEIRMKVERVDQVELEDVDQIDADLFTDLDGNGMVLVVEGNAVDRVKIIRIVEVHINAVHHHDQFTIHRRAALFWIHDEGAIQSLRDVTCKRKDMTVIKMKSEGFRIKFISKAAAGLDEPARARAGHAIHLAGMKPVKMDGVGMVAAIAKVNAN